MTIDKNKMFYKGLVKRKVLIDIIGQSMDDNFLKASEIIINSLIAGGKLLFAGNGGSAAEAQHMSAEYLATLNPNNFRPGIASIALTVDTSFLTAWANDFDYEDVFARQISTLGKENDVFLAYSTKGNSLNIIKAIKIAKEKSIYIIGFTGNDGGKMKNLCDICFQVPSESTPLIQEIHTMLGHELCSLVEQKLISTK